MTVFTELNTVAFQIAEYGLFALILGAAGVYMIFGTSGATFETLQFT